MMKQTLAHRIASIEESATLAMTAKAAEYRSRGLDVINLSLGEPDFKTPRAICEAAKAAIDEGKYFAYPPVAGYLDLRQAIADKYSKENNVPYQAENIVVSNGAKQSIANAIFTLLDPGDEVIVFSPFWVSYTAIIKLAGGVPVTVKGPFKNGFKPTIEQLEAAVTPKTRAVIFSSPCNPTGTVWTEKDLEAIARWVLPHERILVIADEIYERVNFLDSTVSIASFPGMIERTITINGFSKGFAMTGWRVGYMAAPQWIAKGSVKMQGQFTSANCSIAQRAALAALSIESSESDKMVQEYMQRRALVYNLLKEIPDIEVTLPDGAFYFFFDVSRYYHRGAVGNGNDLCMYLLERAHISLVPGSAFGEERCIRLSYAASEAQLTEAIERMRTTLSLLK